jgi:hypothetical protein
MFSIGNIWLALILSVATVTVVEMMYRAWDKLIIRPSASKQGYMALDDYDD